MSQVHWIYKDKNNRCHEVSIYHGDTSGHVLLYCNTSIVKIDFGVHDSKNYAFMIDDQLFQLDVLKKSKNKFEYQLSNIEKSEIVPVDRITANHERRAKNIIFFGIGLITLLLAGILLHFFA